VLLISSIAETYMQELRDIAMTEAVKGKHFFLENDIKGPALKLDNTGKSILIVSVSLLKAFRIAKPCIVKEVKWPVG
jgi:hypothetical protein